MRTTGTVKWFDRAKGEGCVVSESGSGAVLTRATLEAFGLKTIAAGSALAYEMKLTDKGLTVTAIYEIAGQPPRGVGTILDGGTIDVDVVDKLKGLQGRGPRQPRAAATVKWFDPVKGYGFVVSKDVRGDILLHRSVIEEANLATPVEGAVLDVELAQRSRGQEVRRIHAVIDPGIFAPPHQAPLARPLRPREVVLDEPTGPWIEAECKWFSRPKGYGFVVPVGDTRDVFVHMDLLRKHGLRELRMGERVKIRVGRGPKGLTATEIALVPDAPRREGPCTIPYAGGGTREGKRTRPAAGETLTGVVAELLTVNEAGGFGIMTLAELDAVAYAPLALLRAAGALDPKTCGRLICDVEFVPPRLVVRCLTRLH